MSMSTCRAQSDSIRENPMLVVLGEGDGRGEGTVRERETRGRERGEGDEERGMRGTQS